MDHAEVVGLQAELYSCVLAGVQAGVEPPLHPRQGRELWSVFAKESVVVIPRSHPNPKPHHEHGHKEKKGHRQSWWWWGEGTHISVSPFPVDFNWRSAARRREYVASLANGSTVTLESCNATIR